MCKNFGSGSQMKNQHFAKISQKFSVYSTQKSAHNSQVSVHGTQETHLPILISGKSDVFERREILDMYADF